VFGTGKKRPLSGVFVRVLDRIAASKRKQKSLLIIALDLPSGLDADTGLVDEACIHADHTITLGFPKPGLFNFPGAVRAGRIIVADIGIPAYLAGKVHKETIESKLIKSILPERSLTANKGNFGRVLVIAGSINYIGAAYLACMGAIRVGAGLVTLATAVSLQPILATKLVEATYLPLPESESGIISPAAAKIIHREFGKCGVLLMGCGLGQNESVIQFIELTIFVLKPALSVLDADALNALAKIPHWWKRFTNDAVITPHPGEMARMAGVSIDEVQSDRMGIAREMAQKWNKTIVLKGAYTVVAAPDGRCRVSLMANPGLATAGTGDVLAGTIAGLLAQDLSLFDAATGGVFLHGEAGEILRNKVGDAGMIAGDLLSVIPLAIKKLKETQSG
jgi:NAD(P)H-hydrate epimerase